MKALRGILLRVLCVLGLLLLLLTLAGVMPAGAGGPLPPATPTAQAPMHRLNSSVPGLAATSGWAWYDGAIKYSNITACFSDPPIAEYGAGTYVGYTANLDDPPQPTPNMVYYVHVVVMAVGNACAGQYGYIEIGLPAHTSLAISAINPVYCFYNGSAVTPASDCPQSLPLDNGGWNPGMYVIPSPGADDTWPLPIGVPWEFQIPVVSTTTLTNSAFQAKVWVLDGYSSPWLNPTAGVYIYAPTIPGAFGKSAPANAAGKQSSAPTLSWQASSGAVSYEYCIDAVNDNACNASWISSGAATSKALAGLAHGAHYYWQVRARNATGVTYANGGSAAWWSFTTLPLPAAFNKTGPANGTVKLSSSPVLKWAASANAIAYEYCIDTSNNNACNASWISTGAATSKALSGLGHGVHYYWQVRARNAAGVTYANGASTAWSSFVTMPLPGVFNKTGPANGAINQAANPILKWAASLNAGSYQYCIDTINNNACDTSWISAGAATSKALSGLAHGVTYYWQVRARNVAGFRYGNGTSASWWSFTVK